jgi:hypothetical protein
MDGDAKFTDRLLSDTWNAIIIRGRNHGADRSMALVLDQHTDFVEVIGAFEINFGSGNRLLMIRKERCETTDISRKFWSDIVKRKGEWIRLG